MIFGVTHREAEHRHREFKRRIYCQGRIPAFAWMPVRLSDGRWIWMQRYYHENPYWIVGSSAGTRYEFRLRRTRCVYLEREDPHHVRRGLSRTPCVYCGCEVAYYRDLKGRCSHYSCPGGKLMSEYLVRGVINGW